MNDSDQWGETRSSAPPARGGLRPTLPSQPAPRTQPPASGGLRSALPSESATSPVQTRNVDPYSEASAYGQESAYRQPMERQVVRVGGVDREKRIQGFKNILGGAVLIGIGLTFGGSVFLGNPEAIDYFFDGLGTLWILKGVWDVFSA